MIISMIIIIIIIISSNTLQFPLSSHQHCCRPSEEGAGETRCKPEVVWDVNDQHERRWQHSQDTSHPPHHRHIGPSHELRSSLPSFSSLHSAPLPLLLLW